MRHICKGEDEEGRSRDLKRKRQSRHGFFVILLMPNHMPPCEIHTGLDKISFLLVRFSQLASLVVIPA